MDIISLLLALYSALMSTKDWALQELTNNLVEMKPQKIDPQEKKTYRFDYYQKSFYN